MKFTITIDQVGVQRAGLADKTDLVDWALLDYLVDWAGVKQARRIIGDDNLIYVWCNYEHLMAEMPLLGITTKGALSRRFEKLRTLGLLKTIQQGNHTYVNVTDDTMKTMARGRYSDI